MRKLPFAILFILSGCVFLFNCKKQVEEVQYENYSSFSPISIGKFITYQLDSTVSKSFGTGFNIHSYTVKDSIEAQFTDNLNRPSYRIVRYQLSNNQWVANNTFFVTPAGNSLEQVENNLRIIKLVNPVADGKSWLGNSYVSDSPFFTDPNFATWTYVYSNLETPFALNNQTFDSTVTVVSFDSSTNQPFYYKQYSTYAKGYEVYAKNIGKIYQDILSWEYQAFTTLSNCKLFHCAGNMCDTTSLDCNNLNCDSIRKLPGNSVTCDTLLTNYYYNGYGVKLTMIDHN